MRSLLAVLPRMGCVTLVVLVFVAGVHFGILEHVNGEKITDAPMLATGLGIAMAYALPFLQHDRDQASGGFPVGATGLLGWALAAPLLAAIVVAAGLSLYRPFSERVPGEVWAAAPWDLPGGPVVFLLAWAAAGLSTALMLPALLLDRPQWLVATCASVWAFGLVAIVVLGFFVTHAQASALLLLATVAAALLGVVGSAVSALAVGRRRDREDAPAAPVRS